MPSPALAYFLAGRSDVVAFECLEISHPSFTQVYRKVRNNADGLDVLLETGAAAHFDYYPMEIVELGDRADLDMGIRVSFGDLGEVLPLEIDAVEADDGMAVKPTITYRVYRSDDLTSPLIGPLVLQATTFSFKREGASFEAAAPYVNKTRTGEMYSLTRFPMLRAFMR